MDNIKQAVRDSVRAETILKAAKANGIYSEGESLDRFAQGLMSGVYSMASNLGLSNSDISQCLTNEGSKADE